MLSMQAVVFWSRPIYATWPEATTQLGRCRPLVRVTSFRMYRAFRWQPPTPKQEAHTNSGVRANKTATRRGTSERGTCCERVVVLKEHTAHAFYKRQGVHCIHDDTIICMYASCTFQEHLLHTLVRMKHVFTQSLYDQRHVIKKKHASDKVSRLSFI